MTPALASPLCSIEPAMKNSELRAVLINPTPPRTPFMPLRAHVLCAAVMCVSFITGAIVFSQSPRDVILVGTGCAGASSIAVAWEEDAMPVCAAIDAHNIPAR